MRLLLLCVVFAASFLSGNGHELAPTLIWTSVSNGSHQAEPTVVYRTVKFLDLWKATLNAFVTHGEGDNAYYPQTAKTPEVFVVFVSGMMEPWMLSGDASVSEALSRAFTGSASKYVFNNVRVERGRVRDLIPPSLSEMEADVTYLGSCAEAGQPADFASILKAGKGSTPKIVVKCGDGDLTDEMTQLGEMDKALKASQLEYAMLFVSEFEHPNGFINAPQRRRSLKSDEAMEPLVIDYRQCDELCRVRVKFLEGIILAIILSLALTAGLCCMHILDAPTQFEKPEDAET